MTTSASYGEEQNLYASELNDTHQTDLLNRLKANPEDFGKLIFAEFGLPTSFDLSIHGVKGLYKSTGLDKKVDAGIKNLKAKVSNYLKPYQEKFETGLESLKSYVNGGIEGLKDKAKVLVDDSLSGLKESVTGAVRDKVSEVQRKVLDLQSDLEGKYKSGLGELERLKAKGIAEGSARYQEAVKRVEGLKSEIQGRIQDIQAQAQDTLANARDQIESKARSVGDSLKGKAQGALADVKGKISDARAQVEDLQTRVSQGATELQGQLDAAKSKLSSAVAERSSTLQGLSPEVLQSVQEEARAKYLEAQEHLSTIDPELQAADYEEALNNVNRLQGTLSEAVQNVAERASAISSLGLDALQARKAAALADVESAKSALTQGALDNSDIHGAINAAQDRLIEAQTRLRGALVDLGEDASSSVGSYFLSKAGDAATGLGSDLFGALPALALDVVQGASAGRTAEDTGIATAVNRGLNVAGQAFGKIKTAVSGVVKRYQNLTPQAPRGGAEGEVQGVDELGGDVDALAGDTIGTVKSLSSEFVRAGRPTTGFLQSLFGDVTGSGSPSGMLSDIASQVRSGVSDAVSQARTAGQDALSSLTDAGRSALSEAQGSLTTAARGATSAVSDVQSGLRQAASAAESRANFLASQATHPGAPVSSNIAGATETEAAEQGNVADIERIAGVGQDVASEALETGATAIQAGQLEGGVGEVAVGALSEAAEGAAEGVGGALEAAGEATEAATGDTGIGALLGGLALLGGVLYDLFGKHDSEPAPVAIPNYSVPIFQPGSH